MQHADQHRIEQLFFDISREWFLDREGSYASIRRDGVYSDALTIWLMILQRLSGGTLQHALCEGLLNSKGPFVEANTRSRKLRNSDVSTNNGGFSRARQRLSKEEILSLLTYCTARLEKKSTRRIYVIDGYRVSVAHTPQNVAHWGLHKGSNNKVIHFPKVLVVAAHELSSAVSSIPVCGRIDDGEQKLGCRALASLPTGSTVIGDRGFGNFTIAHHAAAHGHTVLLRLTEEVFRRGAEVPKGEYPDEIIKKWEPSRNEARRHCYPPQSAVSGRFIKYRVEKDGFPAQILYFFTNLLDPAEEIAALYLKRQDVELFIRHLKQSLSLELVRAKSPQMVEKEIQIAILTFNLVASIISYVAVKREVSYRRFSFTSTLRILRAFATKATTMDSDEFLLQFETALWQTKLPDRKKQRSFPRVIRRSRDRYPLWSMDTAPDEGK